MRWLKSFVVNALVLACSIALVLLLIEVVFRVFSIDPYPKETQKYVRCEVNAKGRRDHGYGHEKDPGIFRIVAVGDSITWGEGVRKIDDIFLMRVEKALNQGLKKYEIINGAQKGWNTTQEYLWLRDEGVKFSPDLIIVVYFFNDATNMSINRSIVKPLYKSSVAKANSGSVFYDYLKYNIERAIVSRRTIREYNSAYFDKSKLGLWRECQDSILAIKKLANEHNARLLFVIFPILFGLDKNYCFQDIQNTAADFLEKSDIASHNLLPDFVAYKGKQESLWLDIADAHPNEQAHAIAADSLCRYLSGSAVLNK